MQLDFESKPYVILPNEINVNMPNNNMNREYGFGLNQNKRGQIKERDLEVLQAVEISKQEIIKNEWFGKQPPEVIEKSLK